MSTRTRGRTGPAGPQGAEQPTDGLTGREAQPLSGSNGAGAAHDEQTVVKVETAGPALNGYRAPEGDGLTLAVFCYEGPDNAVGRHAAQLAAAHARRGHSVHLFTRLPIEKLPGVHCHATEECEGDDVLERVDEFSRRACNLFLRYFPNGARVTLMGHEWSSVPALSLLRGLKNHDMVLTLRSLERQRSDMVNELSKKIEEIELTGLREARLVLTHDAGTAEVAKYWEPGCAERIVPARTAFPVEELRTVTDPGQVKARYQVGPVDPMVVYLGDLSERYGPDLLVKAMPGVLKNTRQARLVVAGDGGLFWPLRVYTRYLLLEHAVRLPGSVESKAAQELVQAADVVVMPSRESTPWWPVLAAWAAGRPVVTTHNAAPGLVEHEQDAVLCYPSPNSLVWGVERVLFDADLRARMAEKGAEKLEERFGWNSVAEQVEELIGAAVR
jgi:glycosyltransferase involved in cell wall biosynthesis